MSSIIKLLRRIGGTKAVPTSGEEGQVAIWKAGKTATDAVSLYLHDGVQWVELINTKGKTITQPVAVTVAETAPATPTNGDLWFKPTTNALTVWDGTKWHLTTISPVKVAEAAPASPAVGDIWFKGSTKAASVWDGAQWSNIAFTNVSNTFTKAQFIDTSDATQAALRVTQRGAGPAFIVEDEANPDASPFEIASNGNVGIGVAANPAGAKLIVLSSAGFPAFFQSTTNVSDIGFSTSVGQVYIGARDDNLTFKLGGAERAFMDKNGALTFGQTSMIRPNLNTNPGVSITDLTNNFEIRASAPNSTCGIFQRSGSDGNVFLFFKNTTPVGSIGVNATSTGFNTTSDYRLKENVTPINGAAARVMALKPSRFNFKQEPGKIIDGFIAHEVQAVVPEAVTGSKDAMREEDTFDAAGNKNGTKMVPDYQGIDQGKLVPLLTAALQEALKRIEALEART